MVIFHSDVKLPEGERKIHSEWMFHDGFIGKSSNEMVDCPTMFDEEQVKWIFTHADMEVALSVPWFILDNL